MSANANSGLLAALLAVQAEVPTLVKDATNPPRGGTSKQAGWSRARSLYPLGRCEYEDCSEDAVDHHHIDGNPRNNAAENVVRYCRRHHMLVDGRLEALAARAHDAAQLAGRKIDWSRREEAERFVMATLADGTVAFHDMRAAARTAGVSWNAATAAKHRLGVRSRRRATHWVWEKP